MEKNVENHSLFVHGEKPDHFFETPQFSVRSVVDDNGDSHQEVVELSLMEKMSSLGSSAYVDSLAQKRVAPVDYTGKMEKMDAIRDNIDTLNNVEV